MEHRAHEDGRLAALCLAVEAGDAAGEKAARLLGVGTPLDQAIAGAGGPELPPLPPQAGAYRCPQLRCARRATTGRLCRVFWESMVAGPWQLVAVLGAPGPERDAAVDRCLAEAPRPFVTAGRTEAPLRPYGGHPTGAGGTVVAELTADVEGGLAAVERLLAADRTVLLVSEYTLPGLARRFAGRAVHAIKAGRTIAAPTAPADGLEAHRGSDEIAGGSPVTTPGSPLPPGHSEGVHEPDVPAGREMPTDADDAQIDPGRYVNILLADGAGRQVDGSVAAGLPYLVRVGIGRRQAQSILAADSPAFPEQHLGTPDAGWWLQAVLSADGAPVAHGALFLPRTGEGFSCGCVPGGRHSCAVGDRTSWLDLVVLAPRSSRLHQLQLAIHLGAAAVQAFEIDVSIGSGGPAPAARTVYTLSADLAELDRFAGRSVSIRSGDLTAGRHYLVMNDGAGSRVGFSLADAQAGTAARSLRAVLFDRQLSDASGSWRSLYDRGLGKSRDDYLADLRAMAAAGAEAYAALFPDVAARDALAGSLVSGGGPAVIQVAQAEGSRPVVPWQLVYDIPIISDDPAVRVCPSVGEFGPGTAGDAIPDRCPHADGHDAYPGTICPFGFWGLAHILEVPPSSREVTLAEVTGAQRPPSVVVALNETLTGADWDAQRAELDRIGLPNSSVITTSVAALRQELVAGADLLYMFCHGRRISGAGSASGGLALDLGPGGQLTPQDISFWATLKPPIRWAQRRPLVVLNGCYTGERLPETLADFASAFVESTGAAGVLATEVTMESGLAAYSMSTFVSVWGAGRGVGEALRRMRWRLLARGNVMGLAYSPYCDADLRLPKEMVTG